MKIIELELQQVKGLVFKIDKEKYIVINKNLLNIEKKEIIKCLHSHIKLNKFDYILIDNKILINEDKKNENSNNRKNFKKTSRFRN